MGLRDSSALNCQHKLHPLPGLEPADFFATWANVGVVCGDRLGNAGSPRSLSSLRRDASNGVDRVRRHRGFFAATESCYSSTSFSSSLSKDFRKGDNRAETELKPAFAVRALLVIEHDESFAASACERYTVFVNVAGR